jgi:tetratricopeptide (TPR) repeat protein
MNLWQVFNSTPDIKSILKGVLPVLADYERESRLLEPNTKDYIAGSQDIFGGTPSLQKTVERLEDETNLNPDDPYKHLYLAIACNQLRDWERSVEASTRAIDLYSTSGSHDRAARSAVAHLIRGYAYASIAYRRREKADSSNREKAIDDFQESIKLKADRLSVLKRE